MKNCNECTERLELHMFSKNGENIRNICKVCRSKKESERRKNNLETFRKKDSEYYNSNKGDILLKNKEYRKKNSEKIKEQKRQYYQSHKEDILKYHQSKKNERNKYLRNRRLTDKKFSVVNSLRARISETINKKSFTNEILGCGFEYIKKWIEFQFDENMNWDNYGKYWHLDHVIPISIFDIENENDQLFAFNWANLRPCYWKENLNKSNKIDKNIIINHQILVCNFLLYEYNEYQINNIYCWWPRVELGPVLTGTGSIPVGKNLKDNLLTTIRSQTSL